MIHLMSDLVPSVHSVPIKQLKNAHSVPSLSGVLQQEQGTTEYLNLLSPYYTMRFPYVALAIKPNANGMYMERK